MDDLLFELDDLITLTRDLLERERLIRERIRHAIGTEDEIIKAADKAIDLVDLLRIGRMRRWVLMRDAVVEMEDLNEPDRIS